MSRLKCNLLVSAGSTARRVFSSDFRYLAKGVELSIDPFMEMVAAERARNGKHIWRR